MAGLRKKQRIRLIIVGLVLMAGAAGMVGYAMQDGIEFFRAPYQIAEDVPGPDVRFRLGGIVEEGSLVRGEGLETSFNIRDNASSVPVRFSQVLPDLFKEGEMAIASGYLVDGVFMADNVLAKHDETYMPREVVDALREQGVQHEGVEPEPVSGM
ncbi:cytochrome c maturation protein CcmE [Oceanicella sp. SM1341]|uniref:cytochrome c maturation protein CcmE n=1 Tax=Oceanicella sp. SM1341 TaxID=1548889 RepID=UPI000E4956EE|nr:cytochrome c maturation protein CcmE [Oceanicella sp. SM1341]